MVSVTYLYTVNPKGTTLVELHILIMLYCFHLAPVFVPCETSSGETLLLCTNILQHLITLNHGQTAVLYMWILKQKKSVNILFNPRSLIFNHEFNQILCHGYMLNLPSVTIRHVLGFFFANHDPAVALLNRLLQKPARQFHTKLQGLTGSAWCMANRILKKLHLGSHLPILHACSALCSKSREHSMLKALWMRV